MSLSVSEKKFLLFQVSYQSSSTDCAEGLALFIDSSCDGVRPLRSNSIIASPVCLSLISTVKGNSSLLGLKM